MALTDKQYNAIERYVSGEMDSNEKEVFEAAQLQDNELAEEVEAYKEIVALADSVEHKIGKLVYPSVKEATSDKEVWKMLEKERKYWEEHLEPEEKRVYGIVGADESSMRGGELQGRTLRMNRMQLLAAAVLITLLSAGGLLWWYVQPENNKAAVAIHIKKPDSSNLVNKNGNEQGNLISKGPDSSGIGNSTVVDSAAKKQSSSKKGLSDAEQRQERLYAQNFVPDAAPQDRTFLENAFEHYEKGSYKQASSEYEEAQKEVENLTARTPEDEVDETDRKRILFYAHYYNALSCMANNNAAKAIPELQKAINESTDSLSGIKAQWYLSLAYLKTRNVKKTEELLGKIARSKYQTAYKAKATALLNELKEQ